MSRPTSFFLDLLRLLAAFAVFGYHCVLFWAPDSADGKVGELGHRAVIAFFVISGYVIAFATLRKTSDFRGYVLARLSRLYSVVAPAVLLTLFLQALGTWLNPAFYHKMDRGYDAARYFLTTFFLQSLWTTNGSPPTNGPFWSLGYEFWYYAIFGAAVFIRPLRRKIVCVVALLAVSGIDSFLLMPAWLLGVVLYLQGSRFVLAKAAARGALVAAFLATVLALWYLPDCPRHWGYPPFLHSSSFLTDGLLALLLTLLIWAFDQAFRSGQISVRLDAVVRWLADHTFSLYLYHFPLILFVTAVIPFRRDVPGQVAAAVAGILGVIVLLSWMTQPTRRLWHRLFALSWDAEVRRWFPGSGTA